MVSTLSASTHIEKLNTPEMNLFSSLSFYHKKEESFLSLFDVLELYSRSTLKCFYPVTLFA